MKTSSSGLLLLLVGVIALSAFINGALPKLLETLFSPGTVPTGGSALVPTAARIGPTVGGAQISGTA